MEETYQVKGVPTEIKATSRVAIKIRDNFYTVESTETRTIPDVEGVDIEQEWLALYDSVNAVTDQQCDDILRTFNAKKGN